MKKLFLTLICAVAAVAVSAQSFSDYFANKTLRIDYVFAGNAENQLVALDELATIKGWAGRRVNLDKIPVRGNGELKLIDSKSGKTIYRTSFSSLFQEWLVTEEASQTTKSFEATFLVPFPKQEVFAEITLRDNKGEMQTSLRHRILPDDK